MTKYVYSFDENKEAKQELLGEIGYKLAKMTKIGLPVVNGFTVTTEAFMNYQDNNKVIDEILAQIFDKITELENKTGKKLGDPTNPLLLSVEIDSNESDEILNIGINNQLVEELSNITSNYMFIYGLYIKYIYRFTEITRKDYKLDSYSNINEFDILCLEYEEIKQKLNEEIELMKTKYKNTFNEDFPQEPKEQLTRIIKSIFNSSVKKTDDNKKIAVNIQEVILGDLKGEIHYGKFFTRNPFTGKNELYVEYLDSFDCGYKPHFNMWLSYENLHLDCHSEEDEINQIYMKNDLYMLKQYKKLIEYAKRIEKYFNDMQYIEFVVANDKLSIRQVGKGKRTMQVAQKIAEDMRNEKLKLKQAQQIAMGEIENRIFNFQDEPDKDHILVQLQRSYEFIKQISIFDGLFASKKNLYFGPTDGKVKSKIKRKSN